MALVLVLILIVLLVSSVATFLHRAVLDVTIVENRDAVARAEALARGGVRLGTALLIEDRLRESAAGPRAETLRDAWARARRLELPLADDQEQVLEIAIEDAGARLNLNALFQDGQLRDPASEVLLVELFTRVIEEAGLAQRREADAYDPADLARALVDWVDPDPDELRGGLEDDYYQRQQPPYRAANRPLLSVDELLLVRGFDAPLVDALRPYVGVYPLAKGDGINPNTAPPWVLGLLFHGTAGDYRFADADLAQEIVRLRDTGLLCADTADDPSCTSIAQALPGQVFPPPSFSSEVFVITSQARVGEIRRSVEAVVDRSDPASPLILSWRVR
jgi:general secretion pathway protein K